MVLLLLWLLQTAYAHLIIAVAPDNPEVSATSTLNITILTTQTIPQGGLAITLPPDFAISSPCRVNSTDTTCTYQTSVTAAKVTFSSSSFATSTYYALSVTVTNPVYATNFQVTASASGTPFTNTGVITITPKTISCSMSSQSAYVGDITAATLTLSNSLLPDSSFIVINSTLQTTFSNLFATSPICSIPSGALSCTLSTSFGQQYLTINGIPSSASLAITIKNINNAPYNSSLISGNLQIKNSNSYNMQICTFSQPAPTMLRTSNGASLTNWNSTVGAVSNVTLTIDTYFTPYTTKTLWVYDSKFTVTALTPTSTDAFTTSGSSGYNYLSGGVASGKTLSYLATVTNPTSQIPLLFNLYVIYSTSLFIQNYQISSLKLTTSALTVTVSVTNNTTMTATNYNVSTELGFTIGNGPVVNVTVTYGTLQCAGISLTSNAALTLTTCSTNSLILTASTITKGTVWVSFRVLNYYSVRPDNTVVLSLTSAAPNYYPIGSGSAPLLLAPNPSLVTITNNNPTFASTTTFTLTEPSVTISSSNSRKFTITLPADIQINSSSGVTANSATTFVDNFTVASNVVTATVRGPLMVVLSNLANPKKYLGSIVWTITSTDLEGNPASQCQASQSPFYTPASTSVSLTLSVPKIQTSSNLTLTVIPALQYTTAPNITVTLPTQLITSPCSSCALLSSNSLTFSYSATIMTVTFQVNNSINPTGNSLQLQIAGGGIDYEQKEVSFTLEPMTFEYVASQVGFFGQLGTINITITKTPTTPTTLTYSGLDSLLSSSTCVNCTNTQVVASGIVKYFQAGQVTLIGTANGITYATVQATVYYVCSSIQGCRMCSASTGVLKCQLCFNSTYTIYSLLYNSQCLESCPLATYSNSVTCLDCPLNCQSCTSTECQLCYLGYYVYEGSCLDSCPQPLINNGTHCIPVPIICPSHCANCPLNNKCSACEGGYYLLSDTCYSTCPSSYYPDSTGTSCLLFVPPEQTKYFPFAFLISAVLLAVALVSIKCYQKRSLVMGNLIAFLSIVEIGSMVMTLAYTFRSEEEKDLFTQALLFVLLLSKVLLNLVFLAYFLKVIVEEPDFQDWIEREQSHERLYRVLIVLSSLLSFQCIRIIYSRLMGLRLFFGKFNTSLIFKPLNYFTASHFLTSGVALVIICFRNIMAQQGYKTSIYYSSIETIVLELILLACCIVDNKRGYDDEFFEYQVYKVKNQYEGSHIEPIEIGEQAENAGSMHEILSAAQASSPRHDRSALIVKNPMWVPRGKQLKDVQVQIEEEAEGEKPQGGGVISNKKESLFRRRIIDDWREIEKTLPRHVRNIRKHVPKKTAAHKGKVKESLKRASSVEHIEVRLPEAGSLPQRIKQYFYNLSTGPVDPPSDRPLQRKLNQHSQLITSNEVKSASMQVERDYNSVDEQDEPQSPKGEDKTTEELNAFLQEPQELHSNGGYQPQIDELEEIENEAEEAEQAPNGKTRQYQSSTKLSNNKLLADYRYEEGQEKEKRYRTRKRRVNRQTEEVYLQRLVGSSDRKVRPLKAKKIQF